MFAARLIAAGAVVSAAALAMAPHAAAQEGEPVFAPPVEAVVSEGAEVRVEVRAFVRERPGLLGARERELEFAVSVPPRLGVVEGLQQLPRANDRDGAVLTYRHGGGPGAADEFRIAIREAGTANALAATTVTIQVQRPDLRAEPPARLDLGRCPAGESIEGSLVLENTGTAPLHLQVGAWKPFFIENGSRSLYLGPAMRAPVRVVFRPEAPGAWSTPLILKPESLRDYVIEARAIDAITIETNRLDFGVVRIGGESVLNVRLQNVARTPRVAAVQVSGPFVAEAESVHLESRATAQIGVRFRPEHRGEGRGWLVVQEGASILRCQLEGRGFEGAKLAIDPAPVVDMGFLTGQVAAAGCLLSVSNSGDVAWVGAVSVGRPFSIRRSQLNLEPGAAAALDVSYHPASSGSHTQCLVLAGPVTASVTLVAGCLLPEPELAPAGPSATQGVAVAAPPPPRQLAWRPGGESLPAFDPPNLSGRILSDTEARIEWEFSDEHPVERLLVRQRLFVPVQGKRPDFVWQGWPERPQRSPDGKTAGITLRGLRRGWNHVFAIVEVDAEGNLVAQSPLIDVTTGNRSGSDAWLWLLGGAAGVVALAALAVVLWRRTHPSTF